MKRVRVAGDEFTLRYTDSAQAQLEALPFDVLSQVEGSLERICREQDPLDAGHAVEDMPSRCRYEIGPVHVVAWVTYIEPDMKLLTVVEIVFPDEVVLERDIPPQPPEPPPIPPMPPQPPSVPERAPEPKVKPRRILYPRRRDPVPAEV